MKVLFIVNPVAGKGIAMKEVPDINSAMKSIKEVEYSIIHTERPGHATDIARAGAEAGNDIVFAVGGDGTVNEVVNGLVGTSSALGVIPGGSGNDFIRSMGVTTDLYGIIKGAIQGIKKPVDVGIINGRYFVNISSVGFDAEVVLATQRAKRFYLSGSAAYVAGLIGTIFSRKSRVIKMTIDDRVVEQDSLLVAVANGKYYGGGMMAAPDAVLDDGLFDICFISNLSKSRMLMLFPRFMKGRHKGLREVSFYRSGKVYIESKEPIPVNVDGEVFMDTKVEFQIIKDGIFIAVPDKMV